MGLRIGGGGKGKQVRAGRASTGSITGGGAASVTVTFDAFADTSYTAAAVVEDSNGDL